MRKVPIAVLAPLGGDPGLAVTPMMLAPAKPDREPVEAQNANDAGTMLKLSVSPTSRSVAVTLKSVWVLDCVPDGSLTVI